MASRRPDVLKANGGGANAILVRGGRDVAEHRATVLARRPERRVMHGLRIGGGSGWVVNLHASTHPPARRRADLLTARATALDWAAGAPLVFGGDLNATRPALAGLEHLAGNHVDHILAAGWVAAGPAERLDAGALSDHEPLRVALVRGERPAGMPGR